MFQRQLGKLSSVSEAPASWRQLAAVGFASGLPFVVFGVLDNGIMVNSILQLVACCKRHCVKECTKGLCSAARGLQSYQPPGLDCSACFASQCLVGFSPPWCGVAACHPSASPWLTIARAGFASCPVPLCS